MTLLSSEEFHISGGDEPIKRPSRAFGEAAFINDPLKARAIADAVNRVLDTDPELTGILREAKEDRLLAQQHSQKSLEGESDSEVDESQQWRTLAQEQAQTLESAIESIEYATEVIADISKKPSNLYEELYDKNPSYFADMPAEEFVAVAQEYTQAEAEVEKARHNTAAYEEVGVIVDSLIPVLENETDEKGEPYTQTQKMGALETVKLVVNTLSNVTNGQQAAEFWKETAEAIIEAPEEDPNLYESDIFNITDEQFLQKTVEAAQLIRDTYLSVLSREHLTHFLALFHKRKAAIDAQYTQSQQDLSQLEEKFSA